MGDEAADVLQATGIIEADKKKCEKIIEKLTIISESEKIQSTGEKPRLTK